MKIVSTGINFLKAAWNLTPRWIVFFREGEKIFFSVFKKQKEGWREEVSGEGVKKEFFYFPRVLTTRFAAVLPLEKGQVLEWKSPLRDKKKVLQVLPYEMESQLPYPLNEVVLDCLFARKEGEEFVWHVVSVLKSALKEETDFWKSRGLYLDHLEWEGNLQAQQLKTVSQTGEGGYSTTITTPFAVHFALAQGNALLAQKIFLTSSGAHWKKRVELILSGASHEKIQEIPVLNQRAFAFSGFLSRLKEGKQASLNFLNREICQRLWGSFALQKALPFSWLLLAAALALTSSLLMQRFVLNRELGYLKEQETQALQKITEKLGLSEQEIKNVSLAKLVAQKNSSFSKTFLETSAALSQTSSKSYQGRTLEIGIDHFSLEGETDTFAEAEAIEKELSAASVLRGVTLTRSEKNGAKVSFKIEADRND